VPAILSDIKPILIAGPTASGKSTLALELAKRTGGAIINADALQVYEGWQILSARPDAEDLAKCPHYMYGHVAMKQSYSVGQWLRDITAQLHQCAEKGERAIIVGGTGLYFTALTKGLADIPDVPKEIRAKADQMCLDEGRGIFADLLKTDDPKTYARIDVLNPVRTQRAWEVLQATGTGLSEWQDTTHPAILPETDAHLISLVSEPDWINKRVDTRFDIMIDLGALDECQNALNTWWDERLPSCKAIGAKELISYLQGETDLTDAIEAAKVQTRRYAKRQRTWFRGRMKNWQNLHYSNGKYDTTDIL